MHAEFDEEYQDSIERNILIKEIARLKEYTKMILTDGQGNLYHVREEDAEPISDVRKQELQSQLNADLNLLNGGNAASNQDQPSQPAAPVDQPVQPQLQVDPNGNPINVDPNANPVPPADPNAQPAVDPNPVVPPIQ